MTIVLKEIYFVMQCAASGTRTLSRGTLRSRAELTYEWKQFLETVFSHAEKATVTWRSCKIITKVIPCVTHKFTCAYELFDSQLSG
jgi:hypothetical protein